MVLLVCALFGAAMLGTAGGRYADFFGLWSFARFLHSHPADMVYQPAALQAFQHRIAPGFQGFYPCPYSPSFLALTRWLGAMPLSLAAALWDGLGVICLAGASALLFGRGLLLPGILALLLAPATLMSLAIGETGCFSAACLLAGFALLPKRPVVAGMVLGLLSLKPQLAVLVPVAMAARGDWTAMAAAAAMAALLGLWSCLCFAPGCWLAWAQSLPHYKSLVQLNDAPLMPLMANIGAACINLGAATPAAFAVQLAGSLMIAVLVWRAFQGAAYRLAVAVLLAGGALAAPHAFAYDTSFIPAAILLGYEYITANRQLVGSFALLSAAAVYLWPLMLHSDTPPWLSYAWPEAALLAVLVGLSRGAKPGDPHDAGGNRLPAG